MFPHLFQKNFRQKPRKLPVEIFFRQEICIFKMTKINGRKRRIFFTRIRRIFFPEMTACHFFVKKFRHSLPANSAHLFFWKMRRIRWGKDAPFSRKKMRRIRDTLYKGFCYKNSKKDAPFSGDQNVEKRAFFWKNFVIFGVFCHFLAQKVDFLTKKDAPFSLKQVKKWGQKVCKFLYIFLSKNCDFHKKY